MSHTAPERRHDADAAAAADQLLRFVDDSPTPFHACQTVAAALDAAGWTRIEERDAWPTEPGRRYLVRAGSLVAWSDEASTAPTNGFRVVGGHTDSPNLRLKQNHDVGSDSAAVVALEPYGGPLLDTWFDRDLGVSGRVVLRDGSEHLVRVDEPVLRVPHLAIHLDEDRKGRDIDPQRHLNAIWGVEPREFLPWLCKRQNLSSVDILGFELMAHSVQPSARVGADGELVAAPRLDNQATCFAGLTALLAAEPVDGPPADARAVRPRGGRQHQRARRPVRPARPRCSSASCSRPAGRATTTTARSRRRCARPATWRTRRIRTTPTGTSRCTTSPLAGGPVLKVNQNLRYASESRGAAAFALACEQAEVPLQRYVHRADLPCGSTIGPQSAARTGMITVDVGAPQLAMHSIREVMATADVDLYIRALTAFLSPQGRLPA